MWTLSLGSHSRMPIAAYACCCGIGEDFLAVQEVASAANGRDHLLLAAAERLRIIALGVAVADGELRWA